MTALHAPGRPGKTFGRSGLRSRSSGRSRARSSAMRTSFRFARGSLAAALLAAPLLGCGGPDHLISTTTAIYLVPASLDELSQETFFDHPWPSDLRLEDGSPRLTGYY